MVISNAQKLQSIILLFSFWNSAFANQEADYKIKNICPQNIIESNDGKTLYVSEQGDQYNKYYQEFDLLSGKKQSTKLEDYRYGSYSWSRGGSEVIQYSYIAAYYNQEGIEVLRPSTGEVIWKTSYVPRYRPLKIESSFNFSPDNKIMVGTFLNKVHVDLPYFLESIMLWDFRNQKLLKRFDLESTWYRGPIDGGVSPSGKTFFQFSFFKWKDDQGKVLPFRALRIDIEKQTIEEFELPIDFLEFPSIETLGPISDTKLFIRSGDSKLYIYDIEKKSYKLIGEFKNLIGNTALKDNLIYFADEEDSVLATESTIVVRTFDINTGLIETKGSYPISNDRKAAYFDLTSYHLLIGDEMCEELSVFNLPH